MRKAATVSLALSVLAIAGCDDRRATLPTAPSPPAAPVAPAPPPVAPVAPVPPGFASIRTSIALTAISPMSGTTVPVRDCPPGPFGTVTTLCTDQVRATFSVLNEGSARNGRLRVVFSDGTRQCGSTWSPESSFAPRTSVQVSTSTVFLSSELSEGDGSPVTLIQPCELPVTTTRIVVELWEPGNARSAVAVQAFDGAYTFAR